MFESTSGTMKMNEKFFYDPYDDGQSITCDYCNHKDYISEFAKWDDIRIDFYYYCPNCKKQCEYNDE